MGNGGRVDRVAGSWVKDSMIPISMGTFRMKAQRKHICWATEYIHHRFTDQYVDVIKLRMAGMVWVTVWEQQQQYLFIEPSYIINIDKLFHRKTLKKCSIFAFDACFRVSVRESERVRFGVWIFLTSFYSLIHSCRAIPLAIPFLYSFQVFSACEQTAYKYLVIFKRIKEPEAKPTDEDVGNLLFYFRMVLLINLFPFIGNGYSMFIL